MPRGRGGRGRSAGGRERGADMRYNLEITLDEAFHGKTAELKIPTSITCEACSGTGAKPGSKPKACPTCGGAGRVRATQGLLLHRAHLPELPRARRGHRRSLRRLRRRRPRHPRAHALGQHPGRRRGRHAHPARRRGRGRPARRAGGRPLHLPVAQAPPVLPARRGGPVLPRADLHGDGGARRRVQRADARAAPTPR